MTRFSRKLRTPHDRAVAHRAIERAPDGYVCDVGEETRTLRQNNAIHGLITQIMRQRPTHNGVKFSMAAYKAVFMAGIGEEVEWVPNLDGNGMVPVGLSTSALSVSQFNAFMEFVFAWCAREGLTIRHFDEFSPAAQGAGGANNPAREAA